MKRSLTVFATPLLALSCAFGCDKEGARQVEQRSDANQVDEQANPAAGDAQMEQNAPTSITITAAESAERGLPKAKITLDLGETFMTSQKFPGDGVYLSMSGPPGAPLGLSIRLSPEAITDEEGWQRYVEQTWPDEAPKIVAAAEAELCGSSRPACTFPTGESLARTHHLMASIEIPDSDQAIIVHFSQAAGKSETPAPSPMVREGRYAQLLQSISINFE